MADPGTALRNVTLDDKYDLSRDRVFITGTQAIIRLLLMQRERDRLAGLSTAGFVSGLSRLSDRRPRPEPVPGEEVARAKHRVPARPQRGTGGDRGLGLPAGGDARRGQVRRRVRHVVRQGPRRRPLGGRLPPRQHGRLFETRRRARPHGRRPYGGILHRRAPVRVPLRRRDDPDPEPGRRSGDSRLRPLRLCHEPLLRHLGRLQVREGEHRVDGFRRWLDRPGEDRHAGRFPDAARRPQHPPAATACSTRRRAFRTSSATPCWPS